MVSKFNHYLDVDCVVQQVVHTSPDERECWQEQSDASSLHSACGGALVRHVAEYALTPQELYQLNNECICKQDSPPTSMSAGPMTVPLRVRGK
jgi:hypothetical protein